MSDYLDAGNEELLKDFFSEAEQQVEQLESNILVIEQDPTNRDAVDEIFRAAHTLKGGAATVEMHELSGFTHAVEDLLDGIRSEKVTVDGAVVDLLLTSLDVIKAMLESRAGGGPYAEDVSDLVARLRSYLPASGTVPGAARGLSVSSPNAAEAAKGTAVGEDGTEAPQVGRVPPLSLLSEYDRLELREIVPPEHSVYALTVRFDESNLMNTVGGIQVFTALKSCASVLKTVPDFDALYQDMFHEYVVYFVSTVQDSVCVSQVASIPDVTLSVSVAEVALADLCTPLSEHGELGVCADAGTGGVSEGSGAAVRSGGERVPNSLPKQVAGCAVPSAKDSSKATSSGYGSGSVLRVDAKRIDYLLNLVSETVIIKASLNQSALEFGEVYTLFQNANGAYKERLRKFFDRVPAYLEEVKNGQDADAVRKGMIAEAVGVFDIFSSFENGLKQSVTKFRSSAQNLGRISGELQEGVMKIRMVPISQIFSRYPRVVRDLSRDLRKEVRLVIEGEETELDKSVVEDLLDPIMHCVRNSLDHGIEAPEVRARSGKPAQGTLLLRASNEGNMIVIEVADDGRGIDVEAVKTKAVERGVLHPGKNLTEVEAFQLIFAPGFSTSRSVSNVSGRGVGLDVVKTHIERLNGTVSVFSEVQKGTRFVIKLPLTLAIIQGLLIRVGQEVYSIPIASVIESHRIKSEEINRIDNYEVFNVRNEVISLLRLDRLFGISCDDEVTGQYHYVVIVGAAEKKVGLMVDALIGEEDVVIKPLRDQFTSSPGIAGASILGDGSVSLIIDVGQLLELGLKREILARERREATVW
ncbi:chemotaxis protein CheA [Treponema pallidum]|uniref:chemotaxis protein CheA n=1 Tax=Treponema pallidum TaxID=160 RepID=UPI00217EDA1E|nr:chemotaxis protein CheA [Treponema pallidum]